MADIETFGPEGAYDIRDTVSARYEDPTIDAISAAGSTASVTGSLSGAAGSIFFTLTFKALSSSHLRFTISVGGNEASGVNRLQLRCGSSAEEGFFGFGLQLTYFNQKGNLLPILVQEHGIGRGRRVVTAWSISSPATAAAAPMSPSARRRSSSPRGCARCSWKTSSTRPSTCAERPVRRQGLVGGDDRAHPPRAIPLELIEAYTAYAGRMRPLPDWVHHGMIAGFQGGTEVGAAQVRRP